LIIFGKVGVTEQIILPPSLIINGDLIEKSEDSTIIGSFGNEIGEFIEIEVIIDMIFSPSAVFK
jgi:hypothetical protein